MPRIRLRNKDVRRNEEFEKVKEEFIVDSEKYTKKKLAELMKILVKNIKIGKKGEAVVLRKLPTRKVLKLILSARYIAHEVEKTVPQSISRRELEEYSGLKKAVFIARFNEMLRDGFAAARQDSYCAKNILLVEKFLIGLRN